MRTAIDVALRVDDRPFKEIWTDSSEDVYLLSSPLGAGAAHLESDGKLLYDGMIRPGMLRLRAPGEKLYARIESPSRNLFLTIPGAEFRRMFEPLSAKHRPGNVSFMEPSLTPDSRIHSISLVMLSALTLSGPERQLFVDGLTRSLLALLVTNHKEASISPALPRGGLSALELSRSMEFADANLSYPLALDVWGSVVNMSASEFGRRFQKSIGKSPYAWLLERRIDQSKLLLADRTLTLAEVSLRVGFCSQSHYSSVFRRHVGGSPGRWRRELRAHSRGASGTEA